MDKIQFTDKQIAWISDHKDLINERKFHELFNDASDYHGDPVLISMVFPGQLMTLFYQMGENVFEDEHAVYNRFFWVVIYLKL